MLVQPEIEGGQLMHVSAYTVVNLLVQKKASGSPVNFLVRRLKVNGLSAGSNCLVVVRLVRQDTQARCGIELARHISGVPSCPRVPGQELARTRLPQSGDEGL